MENEQTDAKATEVSSASAESTASTAAATSPVKEEVKVSPAQTNEPSLEEVARKAYEESTKSSETEEGQGQELASTKEDEKVEEEKEVLKTEVTPEKATPDEDLPFHKHPRFQELIAQKNEYEQKVKETEPKLKWLDNHSSFVSRYGITDQEFANAMNLLALQKTDPAKFREALKPVFEQTQEFDPNFIPADLEARVKEGEISEAAAKELTEARASLKRQQSAQQTQQQTWQQKQQVAQQEAIFNWDQSKRGLDPDFKPKSSPNAEDGLWEMTAAKFAYLQTTEFATDPSKIISHLETAYKGAKQVLSRFARSLPNTRPPVTSAKTSTATKKKESDMTVAEVVAATAAKHGINWSPSSNE